jgi:hypothetical protein
LTTALTFTSRTPTLRSILIGSGASEAGTGLGAARFKPDNRLTLVYLFLFALFAASLLGYFAWNTRRLIVHHLGLALGGRPAAWQQIRSRSICHPRKTERGISLCPIDGAMGLRQ